MIYPSAIQYQEVLASRINKLRLGNGCSVTHRLTCRRWRLRENVILITNRTIERLDKYPKLNFADSERVYGIPKGNTPKPIIRIWSSDSEECLMVPNRKGKMGGDVYRNVGRIKAVLFHGSVLHPAH